MIRVLLAAPRPLVWVGLNALLSVTTDLTLLPDLATEQTLPRLGAQLTPELLLLSLLFVPGESARPLAGLHAGCPQTRTMLLFEAGGCETQDVKALLTTGHVHGLISLTEPAAAWPVALRTVAHGGAWVSETLLNRLLRQTRTPDPAQPALTRREQEVLRLAALGWANKKIAHHLGMAARTVEFHLGNIRQKLKVSTRLEAILWFKE
ncbi:MAG: hypothetical protein DCC55_40820, partial [Chloroflexi bacterium]